jgi:hypothetical protein
MHADCCCALLLQEFRPLLQAVVADDADSGADTELDADLDGDAETDTELDAGDADLIEMRTMQMRRLDK